MWLSSVAKATQLHLELKWLLNYVTKCSLYHLSAAWHKISTIHESICFMPKIYNHILTRKIERPKSGLPWENCEKIYIPMLFREFESVGFSLPSEATRPRRGSAPLSVIIYYIRIGTLGNIYITLFISLTKMAPSLSMQMQQSVLLAVRQLNVIWQYGECTVYTILVNLTILASFQLVIKQGLAHFFELYYQGRKDY